MGIKTLTEVARIFDIESAKGTNYQVAIDFIGDRGDFVILRGSFRIKGSNDEWLILASEPYDSSAFKKGNGPQMKKKFEKFIAKLNSEVGRRFDAPPVDATEGYEYLEVLLNSITEKDNVFHIGG